MRVMQKMAIETSEWGGVRPRLKAPSVWKAAGLAFLPGKNSGYDNMHRNLYRRASRALKEKGHGIDRPHGLIIYRLAATIGALAVSVPVGIVATRPPFAGAVVEAGTA